jgi:hypothetical protein
MPRTQPIQLEDDSVPINLPRRIISGVLQLVRVHEEYRWLVFREWRAELIER